MARNTAAGVLARVLGARTFMEFRRVEEGKSKSMWDLVKMEKPFGR